MLLVVGDQILLVFGQTARFPQDLQHWRSVGRGDWRRAGERNTAIHRWRRSVLVGNGLGLAAVEAVDEETQQDRALSIAAGQDLEDPVGETDGQIETVADEFDVVGRVEGAEESNEAQFHVEHLEKRLNFAGERFDNYGGQAAGQI